MDKLEFSTYPHLDMAIKMLLKEQKTPYDGKWSVYTYPNQMAWKITYRAFVVLENDEGKKYWAQILSYTDVPFEKLKYLENVIEKFVVVLTNFHQFVRSPPSGCKLIGSIDAANVNPGKPVNIGGWVLTEMRS